MPWVVEENEDIDHGTFASGINLDIPQPVNAGSQVTEPQSLDTPSQEKEATSQLVETQQMMSPSPTPPVQPAQASEPRTAPRDIVGDISSRNIASLSVFGDLEGLKDEIIRDREGLDARAVVDSYAEDLEECDFKIYYDNAMDALAVVPPQNPPSGALFDGPPGCIHHHQVKLVGQRGRQLVYYPQEGLPQAGLAKT
ncbi:Protein arg-6 [Penicillium canescens]|nr:Protein arg-6 [Penicillium canescens]